MKEISSLISTLRLKREILDCCTFVPFIVSTLARLLLFSARCQWLGNIRLNAYDMLCYTLPASRHKNHARLHSSVCCCVWSASLGCHGTQKKSTEWKRGAKFLYESFSILFRSFSSFIIIELYGMLHRRWGELAAVVQGSARITKMMVQNRRKEEKGGKDLLRISGEWRRVVVKTENWEHSTLLA